MLKISGSKITLNRGDTAFLTINVRTNTGETYELKDTDALWFAVKKNATDDDYAIAPKKLNGNVLELMTEDTINLDFGDYLYDISLIDSHGYISTIVQPSTFTVAQSITAAGDR